VTTIQKIIDKARGENRTFLLEPESKRIIKELGIPTTDFAVAKSADEVKSVAKKVGFPLAMKIVSPQVIHKTDAGGVQLNIKTEKEAINAYNKIIANIKKHNPNAEVQGVLLEKMAEPADELIIGVTRDPTFGPAVMFGFGGIFVEVLKDVAFRIAPITERDAMEMIHEIKALPILLGARGGPKVNLQNIVDVLLKVSQLSIDYIQDILEVDLNPIFAYENDLLVVDARIILTKKEE